MESSTGVGGYYRLAFGGEETECIGYHASSDSLQVSKAEGIAPPIHGTDLVDRVLGKVCR